MEPAAEARGADIGLIPTERKDAMRKVAIGALVFAAASPLTAQAPAQGAGQAQSQMSVGTQDPPPPAVRQPAWLDSLSPTDKQRLIEAEQGRRGTARPATSLDCRAEHRDQPMSDLERAAWDIKCGN
jgi:hypothetical protein